MSNKFLTLLSFIVIIVSCHSPKPQRIELQGATQGTTYSIIYYTQKGAKTIKQTEIDSLLREFENSCSLFSDSSLISRLNRNETDTVDRYIADCETIAREIWRDSRGSYDITIKPLVEAYGFLRQEAQKSINIDSILNFIGHDKIEIVDNRLIKSNPNVTIDLNSIAQGYSVDLISDFIASKGVENFLVEIGGEVYCKGTKPEGSKWSIGIDKPIDNSFNAGENIALVLDITDKAVNTSGNYRKFYTNDDGKRINHTIDPVTGETATNDMLSVTVIANSAAIADGYATMFMVIGSEKTIEFLDSRDDMEAYVIYLDTDNQVATFATDMVKKYARESFER